MRYSDSILGNLLKTISRRWFDGLVDRHAGNAYDKKFGSFGIKPKYPADDIVRSNFIG